MACRSSHKAAMGRLDHPATPSAPGCSSASKPTSAINGCTTPGGRHEVALSAVTSPAEVFRTDLITAMKKPDGDAMTDAEYAMIDDAWKPEWERGVQVCVKPDISMRSLKVKPGVTVECPKKFAPPATYIEAPSAAALQLPYERTQYDMDNHDAQWLLRVQKMDIKGAQDVDEDKFEAFISFLDLKCHENMCEAIKTDDGLGEEYDADVMCAVCRELDSEDENEMVFCDRCNICVHQACYGIRSIPSGKWFCSPCANNVKPLCVLCGQSGGALKPVRLGTRWAHISCALWIPEVKIANVETMEPISNFHAIPQSRWNLVCSICRIRQGACIQCCVSTCTVAFHVECAFQQSLKMKSRIDQTVSDAVRNEAYCPRHALLAASPGPGHNPSTPQVNQRERRLKAMMENFHQYARHSDLARKYRLAKVLATTVHSYWVLKRRMRMNQPFLILPDPWQVVAEERLREFQEEKEKDEAEDQLRPMVAEWELEWDRFMILRQDMEKSRNLSYMILRRERWKKQLLDMQRDVFLKCAELALVSDDSQNLSLAFAVVKSLHPPPTVARSMEDSSLPSPSARSSQSLSVSPASSPMCPVALDVGEDQADLPAKRLRSTSSPSKSVSTSSSSTASSGSGISGRGTRSTSESSSKSGSSLPTATNTLDKRSSTSLAPSASGILSPTRSQSTRGRSSVATPTNPGSSSSRGGTPAAAATATVGTPTCNTRAGGGSAAKRRASRTPASPKPRRSQRIQPPSPSVASSSVIENVTSPSSSITTAATIAAAAAAAGGGGGGVSNSFSSMLPTKRRHSARS